MKKFAHLFGILFCLFSGINLSSQIVHFAHGSEILPENIKDFSAPESDAADIIQNKYVRYVQFGSVLTTEQSGSLEEQGVSFIGYVHFGAYLTVIPVGFDVKKLGDWGAKSVVAAAPLWKMHRNLKERPFGDWAVHGSQIDVTLQVYPFITIEEGAELARKQGITILETGTQNGYLLVRIDQSKIETTAALPFVQWMEQKAEPGEKEDFNGRSLHRANLLDSDHPLGKKYNGKGVNILVRDDGAVGPHIDFQGRLYNQDGVSSPGSGTHGDGVAGIIGGTGNLDPTKKGMSAGADVYVINYSSQFQDETLPLFLDNNVTITNSSYSNGCNAGYTVASQTVDQQIYDHPTLMHVFSSGNSNGSDCDYGAGNQWGNVTGGHKMAKNAIATANLRVDGVLETSSSRGPAHDGRIKPDISAHGTSQNSTSTDNDYQVFGGTSAAAPGIAGCLGQLTQAYKTINNTTEAPTALLKLAVLNTANDMGNTGPDFKFGWGHINNYLALKLLEQTRYSSGSVGQGNQNTHNVIIPAGTKQAKLMLYWVDPPANVAAARALLNDLDITVTSPTGTVFRPWKLNPTPDPVILDTPAGVGRDSLNNMEQVSILNPAAGAYTIRVNGFEVPFGPQPYYVAWEFLEDKIKLTYPSGGESLVPGTTEWIRWDAYGNTGAFTLKYSTNGGSSYTTITSPANSSRMFEWTVPAVTSGNVKLVITRGTTSDTTQFPLSIAPQPSNLVVQKVCPDSATLKWTNVNDLSLKYDVFQLGQKYMEVKGTSLAGASQYTIPIQNPVSETWFSIRTSRADGLTGRRINAINWPGGLLGCPQDKDLVISAVLSPLESNLISCSPVTKTVSVTIKNEGGLAATGAMAQYQLNNQPPVTQAVPILQPGQSLIFTFNTPILINQNGEYALNISVVLNGELYVANNVALKSFKATVVPVNEGFAEDFQTGTSLPKGWSIDNPDADITWKMINGITGSDGNTTQSLSVNHYNYSDREQEDYLYLPPLDLSGLTKMFLQFDYSHAQYNSSYVEQLRIEAFPNCDLSATPVVLWQKTDPELSFIATTSDFRPDAAEDWRTDEVSLEQFAGQSVVLRFNAVNDYGNNTFLDNIVFQNRAQPVAGIESTGGNCVNSPIVFSSNISPGENNQFEWYFGPQAQPETAAGPGPHQVIFSEPGNQVAQLMVSNTFGADTASHVIQIGGPPEGLFSAALNGNAAQFTNTSLEATTYLWEFGDNSTSNTINPDHIYAADGVYTVTLTAANDCGQDTYTQSVTVITDATASFTSVYTGTCAPVTATFTNTSSANVISWYWEFPGGNPSTSTEANPQIEYSIPGLYSVTLIVSNGSGNASTVQTDLIYVAPLPTATFSASINAPGVQFDNSSSNATYYTWDFGDGNSDPAASPEHTYSADGIYTVTLTATNDCGSSTSTQTLTVITPVTPSFTANSIVGCSPHTVTFENLSSANATGFIWNFPGGTPSTSTEINPTVVYETPGVYSVELTAMNAASSVTTVQQSLITVDTKPTVGFTVQSVGLSAVFTNLSNNATSYNWDFGDGNSDPSASPAHNYTVDGTYTVTLTAVNDCGSSTFSQSVTIVTPPVANFTLSTSVGCTPLVVTFENQSSQNAAGFTWEFPGGNPAVSNAVNPTITYETPGVYAVKLTAMNSAGTATYSLEDVIVVNAVPVAEFGIFSNDLTVSFTNLSGNATTYQWFFGDGAGSTDVNPAHSYAAAGSYVVTLISTNNCGSTPYSLEFILGAFPSAVMNVSGPAAGCAPLTVTFTDISAGFPDTRLWTFEGGSPAASSESNPVVTYNIPGTYNVTLSVTNVFGTDNVTKNGLITVIPLPEANFDYSAQDENVTFINTSSYATTYEWNFGDGSGSLDENPEHLYNLPGTYTVTLLAINECDTAVFVKTILITVGAPELPDWVTTARIYPNPNTGIFTLEMAGIPKETLQLELVNSLGQVIRTESVDFSSGKWMRRMDYGQMPAGIYSLRVKEGSNFFVLRVIME